MYLFTRCGYTSRNTLKGHAAVFVCFIPLTEFAKFDFSLSQWLHTVWERSRLHTVQLGKKRELLNVRSVFKLSKNTQNLEFNSSTFLLNLLSLILAIEALSVPHFSREIVPTRQSYIDWEQTLRVKSGNKRGNILLIPSQSTLCKVKKLHSVALTHSWVLTSIH